MYQMSNKVMRLITEDMKNLKVELTPVGKTLADEKILRHTIQGDALSPLVYVIAMMPLNCILRGFKFTKLQVKLLVKK